MVTNWYNFCREVCSSDLLANPLHIGRPGTIVPIDESIIAKSKLATHEHSLCPAVGLQRGVQPGTNRFFMELVDLRDAATLVPTIQRYIRPNNHIWSDKWPAYNGCVHQTVNHSRHYVDPATGSHTKKIEVRWLACKSGFKCWYGIARHLLPSYIDVLCTQMQMD